MHHWLIVKDFELYLQDDKEKVFITPTLALRSVVGNDQMATSDSRRERGQCGEQLATAFLRQQGYTIITTNWRCKHGEIDIVARQNAVLVFVEVRTRRSATTEAAFESITPRKRSRLRALAYAYLTDHRLENSAWRVDVIAIALPRVGQPLVDHLEDALDW